MRYRTYYEEYVPSNLDSVDGSADGHIVLKWSYLKFEIIFLKFIVGLDGGQERRVEQGRPRRVHFKVSETKCTTEDAEGAWTGARAPSGAGSTAPRTIQSFRDQVPKCTPKSEAPMGTEGWSTAACGTIFGITFILPSRGPSSDICRRWSTRLGVSTPWLAYVGTTGLVLDGSAARRHRRIPSNPNAVVLVLVALRPFAKQPFRNAFARVHHVEPLVDGIHPKPLQMLRFLHVALRPFPGCTPRTHQRQAPATVRYDGIQKVVDVLDAAAQRKGWVLSPVHFFVPCNRTLPVLANDMFGNGVVHVELRQPYRDTPLGHVDGHGRFVGARDHPKPFQRNAAHTPKDLSWSTLKIREPIRVVLVHHVPSVWFPLISQRCRHAQVPSDGIHRRNRLVCAAMNPGRKGILAWLCVHRPTNLYRACPHRRHQRWVEGDGLGRRHPLFFFFHGGGFFLGMFPSCFR